MFDKNKYVLKRREEPSYMNLMISRFDQRLSANSAVQLRICDTMQLRINYAFDWIVMIIKIILFHRVCSGSSGVPRIVEWMRFITK